MVKPWLRRCFRFGIFDLVILTTIVGIVLVVFRPVRSKVHKARPWVVGTWALYGGTLSLLPDGSYVLSAPPLTASEHFSLASGEVGSDWTISPHDGTIDDAFSLKCGARVLVVVRYDAAHDMLEVVDADGEVRASLKRICQMEGPLKGNVPDGTWTARELDGPLHILLEYRHGELIDFRAMDGARDLGALNRLRGARGLTALAE